MGEPLNPEAVVWGSEVLGLPIHDNWWQTETGRDHDRELGQAGRVPVKQEPGTVNSDQTGTAARQREAAA